MQTPHVKSKRRIGGRDGRGVPAAILAFGALLGRLGIPLSAQLLTGCVEIAPSIRVWPCLRASDRLHIDYTVGVLPVRRVNLDG